MALRTIALMGTTDASGAKTIGGEHTISGRLYAVEWVDGDLADGVDGTFSMQSTPSGVAVTFLTLTNANNDAWYYPRVQIHDAAGAGVTYDGTNEVYDLPLLVGTPRLVIAQGGDTKTGGAILYYFED